MYEVKKSLKEWPYLRIVPIVVFTGGADLSNIHSQNHVIYDNDLLVTIYSYKTIFLSNTDMQKIVERLTLLNVREYVDDTTHIKNIREAKMAKINKVSLGICPICGGNLVERRGNYGCFLGCSNYPNCTFTTH